MVGEKSSANETKNRMEDDAADQAFQALYEIFSQPMDRFKGCGRKYILDLVAGRPVFRLNEFDVIFNEALDEAFGPKDGNEIVPEKLARCFSAC